MDFTWLRDGFSMSVEQTRLNFEAVTLPALYLNHNLEDACFLVSLSRALTLSSLAEKTRADATQSNYFGEKPLYTWLSSFPRFGGYFWSFSESRSRN